MNATVFHDIRDGDKIFLCIATPNDQIEASRAIYGIERELPADVTPEIIKSLISDMERETGLSLSPSEILRSMI